MRSMFIAFGMLVAASAGAQTTANACQNVDCLLAAVPMPTLAATRVLQIAQQRMKGLENYTLVGLDWCKASEFKPRFSDGITYSPLNDQPNEYSWFLTYVGPDPQPGYPNVKAVRVLRIKPDGSVGVLGSARA